MHTKTKGNIGELFVAADLYSKGFSVFSEYGDNSKIDIIAAKGNNLYRIQVKSSYLKGGKITLSKTSSGPGYKYEYTKDDIDIFAVLDLDDKSVCYVHIDEFKDKGTLCLRKLPTANNQMKNVRLFADFLKFPE